MKKLLLISIILFLFSCTEESKIKRLDGSVITELVVTNKIQSLIDSAKVTGLAISIFNDNAVVYKKTFGYANFNKKSSLTNETVFHGASLSKTVFGYLVSQLVNEGIIDLDTPLQNYLNKPLPEFEFKNQRKGYKDLKDDKRYKLITARMCLTHTTGFPNWRWMTKENDFFREGKIRFLIDPNTRYSYSGKGINLLQFVIEKITNKGLEELAQERIFKPLNMDMTSYEWQNRFESIYSKGHSTAQKIIPINVKGVANAAGSLKTTLNDYSKFINKILKQTNEKSNITSLLFKPNVRIKSKTQFGYKAWENTDENDSIELSYGLGWGLLESPFGKAAFKEGHDQGFQHYSIIFPKKQIGIIILSNSDNAESIFKELLEITIGDTFTPWKWERYIPYNYQKK